MLKLLLLLVFVLLVVWLLKRSQQRASAAPPPSAERAPEQMVKCAHCGVNQPLSESILTHGRFYCSQAHRLESEARE